VGALHELEGRIPLMVLPAIRAWTLTTGTLAAATTHNLTANYTATASFAAGTSPALALVVFEGNDSEARAAIEESDAAAGSTAG
jgi:hypothetical protein